MYKVLVGINAVFSLTLIIAVLITFEPLDKFPILSLLGLVAPILILINILFLGYWIFKKKWLMLLPLTPLLLAYFTFGTLFKFNFWPDKIQDEDLSIMSFNTRAFNKYNWIDKPEIGDDIMKFVTKEDPDIVCFQEFQSDRYHQLSQYPFRYVNYIFPERRHVVQAILSKYPIIHKGSLDFDSTNNGIYADVAYGKDTIRIYNLHLESLRITPNTSSLTREPSGKLLSRLSTSFAKQKQQAKLFNEHQNACSFRKIICGDLNNTQFSSVYRIVRGNFVDSFDTKGKGFGSTYNFDYLPIRIDFILADKGFEITSHKNYDVQLSDHYPLMSSVRLSQ